MGRGLYELVRGNRGLKGGVCKEVYRSLVRIHWGLWEWIEWEGFREGIGHGGVYGKRCGDIGI